MKARGVFVFTGLFLLAMRPVQAQPPQASPALVQDAEFKIVFDLYWRTRLLGRNAGNRICSLPNSHYDDPKSPFRPLDQRLKAAGRTFETRYPHALNSFRRPYMVPPPQSLCSDPKAAWEAIFAFETAVTALEAQLVIGR